jgi:glutamate synthase domain-containing protein 3
MDGPTIEVFDNSQDGGGNTMNAGNVYIHGHAGDVCGYGMRGGRFFVLGDVGYRVGIHMKAYMGKTPVIVIGGTAGHFLGEYMAGGIIVLLGLEKRAGQPIAGDYLGTGMHGGTIFVRGEVDSRRVGKEVGIEKLKIMISDTEEGASEFSKCFISADEMMSNHSLSYSPKRIVHNEC